MLWSLELEKQRLRSRLIRWSKHAVTARCILELISACGKAQVCSGMERFNILKPNYTCPCIALYAYIESTKSAYESSHFSWVNKKSSSAIYNIFETPFFFVLFCCCFFCSIVFYYLIASKLFICKGINKSLFNASSQKVERGGGKSDVCPLFFLIALVCFGRHFLAYSAHCPDNWRLC